MSDAYRKEVLLSEVMTSKHVIENLTGADKASIVDELVGRLAELGVIESKDDAAKRVMEREELASTALGDGVAIPHARLDVGKKPAIVIGRHREGVDFGAPDGRPVHIFALVVWAPEQAGLFNRLFAGLVSRLARADIRDQILSLPDGGDIARVLSDVRIDMIAGRASKYEADMIVNLQILETKKRGGSRGLVKQIKLARDELAGSMLSRFDNLMTRFGEALVEAPSGVCMGCSMQLSSGFASEMLKNQDSVYVCERCGRFLIHHIG